MHVELGAGMECNRTHLNPLNFYNIIDKITLKSIT